MIERPVNINNLYTKAIVVEEEEEEAWGVP